MKKSLSFNALMNVETSSRVRGHRFSYLISSMMILKEFYSLP